MIWTDDPIRDAERYSAAMDRAERELPRCNVCGNRILGSVYDDGKGNDLCLFCWEEMWEEEEDGGHYEDGEKPQLFGLVGLGRVAGA